MRDIKNHPESVMEWIKIQKTILNWLPKWNVVFTKANKQNVKNKNK